MLTISKICASLDMIEKSKWLHKDIALILSSTDHLFNHWRGPVLLLGFICRDQLFRPRITIQGSKSSQREISAGKELCSRDKESLPLRKNGTCKL